MLTLAERLLLPVAVMRSAPDLPTLMVALLALLESVEPAASAVGIRKMQSIAARKMAIIFLKNAADLLIDINKHPFDLIVPHFSV